jgi:cell shape-determining protein MreC
VLVGKVSSVAGQTSKVTLFSSPGVKYDVEVGSQHFPAIATGRGGGQYQAQLPRDMAIAAGDFVSSPSISAKPFGIVDSVLSDPAEPFLTILFASPVNIYQLRWVLVDTTTKD